MTSTPSDLPPPIIIPPREGGLTALTIRADPQTVFAIVPQLIARAGSQVIDRFVEFFLARIRNRHTRDSYARAVAEGLAWLERHGIDRLEDIRPIHIAAFVETLSSRHRPPTVKRKLAAMRSFLDYLVSGGVLISNPSHAVRGPRYAVLRGTTPVLTPGETRQLIESITGSRPIDLRDRALVSLMVYTFARVSAATGMLVEDYHQQGKRWCIRLREKNGKLITLPVHSQLELVLDAYLEGCSLRNESGSPLFRTCTPKGELTGRRMSRHDALRMIKRRSLAAGLSRTTRCHTFRATGITTYLTNGGTLENAQTIAGHSSVRITAMYDRRMDTISVGEIERIRI